MKILRLFAVASAAFFIAGSAFAQNAGSVTSHAFVIGKGAGQTGYTSLLCGSAQLAVGQSAADPVCRTVTGDVTIDASGVTAIGATKVTNAQLATMAANTTKCNGTAGSAVPTDCTASTMRTNIGVVIGTNVQAWDTDLDCIAAISTTGLVARTGAGTCAVRTVTAPAAGITVTNGNGVSGNPTLALANDLAALEGLSGTGIARRTGTDAWSVGTAVVNSELATAADGTIKSNISGSTATPSDNTITAVLDKLFGTTQGSVIYRGASTWGSLTPGTSGNFLKTQGAAANPVWSAVPGGGDMLSTNNLSDVANVATARANIGALGTRGDQTFTSSGTFTTPANSTTTTVYHYRMQGAGGGGGGGSTTTAFGGGGGAGAYAEGTFTGVAASTGITITVGSGGTAGTTAGGSGSAGGSSSIGSPVSITAGGGGGGTGSTSAPKFGGSGGTVTGSPNIISRTGGKGRPGVAGSAGATGGGGNGADAGTFGTGGIGGSASVAAGADVVQGYGAGGGGSFAAGAPSAGADGIVIIDWVL